MGREGIGKIKGMNGTPESRMLKQISSCVLAPGYPAIDIKPYGCGYDHSTAHRVMEKVVADTRQEDGRALAIPGSVTHELMLKKLEAPRCTESGSRRKTLDSDGYVSGTLLSGVRKESGGRNLQMGD